MNFEEDFENIKTMYNVKITGVGSYIPSTVIKNKDFLNHKFFTPSEVEYDSDQEEIIQKFKDITGIEERRYVDKSKTTSDIAAIAGQKAISHADIDPETLDYIIVAHNYGDVKHETQQSDMVPNIGARVKSILKIKNPNCVAYDLIFGCPGWIQACIHAKSFINSGIAKRVLVIGAETLSRVVDPHDRDSMIYADGAGATILEATDDSSGILTHKTASHTYKESKYIFFNKSYSPDQHDERGYIKMHGRRIYNFALTEVPKAMKACFDESKEDINNLKRIFIHQANEKMDEAIIKGFFKLYDKKVPEGVMPMSISKLGNSSVATIPTLFNLYMNGDYGEPLQKGDIVMFASIGAGMNVNAITYRS